MKSRTIKAANKLQESEGKWGFSTDEQLELHQLQAKKFWAEKAEDEFLGRRGEKYQGVGSDLAASLPDNWSLLDGLKLYDWQQECINNWFDANNQGTVKVVTGAGKTVLALGLIQRLQNEDNPDLRVAVVVPTIVLMNQWYEELIERSNLPPKAIGRLGGGYRDDFSADRRILLTVINSAQAKLAGLVADAGQALNLLLVVDECHRAGSVTMSKIFQTSRAYNLGLSATPEREDDSRERDESQQPAAITGIETKEQEYNKGLLGRQLGPIIYHMSVEDGFEKGILPPYEIKHYGLPLTPEEKAKYERLSRSIKDAKQELSGIAHSKGISAGLSFNKWCRSLAGQDSNLAGKARQYINDTARRKRLLYQASARNQAVIRLLKHELEENPDTRAILFHESIEEAMQLWQVLVHAGLPAVPENSKLSPALRDSSLELFRRGVGQILVSVKSLVEGFNVPATDIGMIVASSTSSRQRIQTIGRVLRKHRTAQGEEKNALIQVLYIDQTVDDMIYAKTDWDRQTGAERNVYYKWDPAAGTPPVEQPGPPRSPLPTDIDVDASQLEPGHIYPGDYEGFEYTADTSGNVYLAGDKSSSISNPQGIPGLIERVKGSAGRFKITPNKQFVLVRVPRGDQWLTLYVTMLSEPFQLAREGEPSVDSSINTSKLKPGDLFVGSVAKDAPRFGYKQVRGRHVITKKSGRGEAYARTSKNAQDPDRGRAAEQILQDLGAAAKAKELSISNFVVTGEGYALVQLRGEWVYIGEINTPLEFPSD